MEYREALARYYQEEIKVIESLDLDAVAEVMGVLEEARKGQHTIFICGNGGSAATASHFVCDFGKGVSMSKEVPYSFECLNDNMPTVMAVANDIGYDEVFVFPLRGKLREGDVVVGISGSGNSLNVVKALEFAKSKGNATVALVGYSGGKLKEVADYCVHVEIDNMQIVEDVHMTLDHAMMYVLANGERD